MSIDARICCSVSVSRADVASSKSRIDGHFKKRRAISIRCPREFAAGVASELTVVDLRDRHELSPTAAFEPLRRVILDKLESVHTEQTQQGMLFSATHFAALWKSSVRSKMRRSGSKGFDCLHVARTGFPSSPNRQIHLTEFLKHAGEGDCDIGDVHTFVASALLMDAYPPGMHCESTSS